MNTRKNLFALLAALLLFVALHAVCNILLSGAAFVELTVQLDHRDRLQVYYSAGGAFSEQHSVSSAMIEPGYRQTVRIKLHNAPAKRLRIDLGDQPGIVQLYTMTVAGSLSNSRVLLPDEIVRLFISDPATMPVRLDKGFAEIQTHKDSHLICTEPPLRPAPLLLWGIPLLFSFLLFILVKETEFSRLAPFADLRNKRPSAGENIDALDGLRGIAVLMVIADHTLGWFSGFGRSGVWIFMTLSGFLLARPFVYQPERALSLSFWSHFFLRRARRILPVYYSYIIAVFLLNCRFEETLLHLLFLKGRGHLWVVPQEMLFYLLTPPVMLLCFLLFKLRPWLTVPGLLGLILLASHFADAVLLRGGADDPVPLYFGIFLSGVLASWFYYGIWQNISLAEWQRCKAEQLASAVVVCILLFFLLFSRDKLWGGTHVLTNIYFPWYGGAAAVLILATLAARQSRALRFLSSLPLRALSVVSYSIYIFHPLVIDLIHQGTEQAWGHSLTGMPRFVAVLLLSYLFACITYSLLERPFLRSR